MYYYNENCNRVMKYIEFIERNIGDGLVYKGVKWLLCFFEWKIIGFFKVNFEVFFFIIWVEV